MKKASKDQLINRLKKEGLTFSDFSLVHEGHYAVPDADWNYKDIPHLHYVHELVEAAPAIIGDDVIASLLVQKIFGVKFPMCLVNYESGQHRQTYYTTWLFFALIIETSYESIGPCDTRVTTNYNIGCSWWLRWLVPLVRFAIKRNYKNLMSTDIPMRERRGKLRDQGYSFYNPHPGSYSFDKTQYILEENVSPSADFRPRPPYQLKLSEVLPLDGEYFQGEDNHVGFRIVRREGFIRLFPRLCLHEGASLDKGKCSETGLMCPWHGRIHPPFAKFEILNGLAPQHAETKYLKVEFFEEVLLIREK